MTNPLASYITRTKLAQAITQALTDAGTAADAKVAAHNAAPGAHNLFFGSTPPAGTAISDFTVGQTALYGPNGKVWLRTPDTSVAPVTTPPIVSTLGERIDLAGQHYLAAYGSPAAQATTTSMQLADILTTAVLQRDQATFDAALTFGEINMRRDKTGSGQTTFLKGYGSSANADGTVTNWTIDSGAEARIAKALIRAWNLWGQANYQTIASAKAALIKSLTISDEGRAYLGADETQKTGALGHHQYNSSWYSKHRLRDYDCVAFRLLFIFTGDPVFKALIEGAYDLFTKSTTQGSMATSTGLLPAYVAYSTADHAVSAITSGTNGWTETQTTDFTAEAASVLGLLAEDYAVFQEARALMILSGAIKTTLTAKYQGGSIVDRYTHTGTAVGSNETLVAYWHAIESLSANDTANTTAAAIRSAKVPTALAQDSGGYYYPSQLQGVTAASVRDGDYSVWRANARDTGKYNDIAILGTNPSIGSTTGTTPTVPVVVVPPPSNPVPSVVGTEVLGWDPNSLAAGWANGLGSGTKKDRATWFSQQPQACWTSINWDPNCDIARAYLAAMKTQGAVGQLLSYSIPLRDVGQYSAGGASDDTAYHAWITLLASVIGTQRVVMVFEPDSLPQLDQLTQTQQSGRIANMRWAMAYLRQQCPNLSPYFDIGHPAWLSAEVAAQRLQLVGVEVAAGFSLNVSNTQPFSDCVAYAQQIRSIIGPSAHFTIDTGRNGNPVATSTWANPPRRRLGATPQWGGFNSIPGLDGVTWWKRPGESDGNSGDGSPDAGQLWSTYLYNDSVGDNVNTDLVSTSSGLLQRPPTPGVAIAPPV